MKGDDGYAQYIDPLENWLKANGVDWDRVVACPQIEVDEMLGTFAVELLHADSDGDATIHRPAGCYTRMELFPLAVPPDPQFWAAYQHSRPGWLRRRELKQLAHDLRFPEVEHSKVTVVIPADGDSLMLFCASHMPNADSSRIVEAMEQLLPGVKVVVVSGFEMLMHKPARRGDG